MPNGVRTTIVIPATLHSRRFPRKVLSEYQGRTILEHVWRAARQARNAETVLVATDSGEIEERVSSWGGIAVHTPSSCSCGTERVAYLARELGAEYLVNVQADQVELAPELIDATIREGQIHAEAVVTPVFRLFGRGRLADCNLVKVVVASDGRALYFSRSAIPFVRDVPQNRWMETAPFRGHIGIYGYGRPALELFLKQEPSALEVAEKLEQLRFLEIGVELRTFETHAPSVSIDAPSDLQLAVQQGPFLG